MAARSKRITHDYEFKAKDFEEDFKAEVDAAKNGVAAKADQAKYAKLIAYLGAWMRDMKLWGEGVRDDIIRLESAVGAAHGEPGDPPPASRT